MQTYRSVCSVALAAILEDDELRPRATLQSDVISDYAQRMKAGDVFPPVLVYAVHDQYWLVDGYHRVAAARSNGSDSIVCEARRGTRLDAAWEGCASNRDHGLRRSNSDKRRSVLRALSHPKGQRLSDRQIAHHCGVHHDMVGRCRRELAQSGGIRHIGERISVRGPSTYLQRVDGIARSNAARHSPRVEPPPATILSLVRSGEGEDVADDGLALLQQTASTLQSASALLASLEEQLGSIAQELGTHASCDRLFDLADARSHCIVIQRAVTAIYTLLADQAPTVSAYSSREPPMSLSRMGDA